MKTWKRALALVLALVMALSLVALPSFAAGEETGGGDTGMPYIKDQGGTVTKDGLVMSKTIKKGENGQFLLTLEAYATGGHHHHHVHEARGHRPGPGRLRLDEGKPYRSRLSL